MIYIFQGLQAICTLPATLCRCTGELLGKCHCGPCKECCREASNLCTGFMGRPLSTYVVLAFLICGFEIYLCYSAFDQEGTCVFPEGASTGVAGWLIAQICFAITNLVFAPYVQCKVWHKLVEEATKAPPPLGAAGGKIAVPKRDVQASFKHVFLYDFGVLAYFFIAVASFCWSCVGFKWMVAGEECGASLYVCAYMGMFLCWVAFTYTFMWYCCECCAKSVELKIDSSHDVQAVVSGRDLGGETDSDNE